MKTTRLRKFCRDYLDGGTANTEQIREAYNNIYTHGTTMQQLCNTLGKSNDFIKLGKTTWSNKSHVVWGLAIDHPESQEDS